MSPQTTSVSSPPRGFSSSTSNPKSRSKVMERSCPVTRASLKKVATSDLGRNNRERQVIRLICKRGKELFVTRSLLTRSSRYFAALLSEGSNWLENSTGTIQLDGWPQSDIATILRSLKTKETESIFANVNHYFTAINYFSIYPLMEQCIEFKVNNITDDSVVDDLDFAKRLSIVALRDKCMEYLLRRLPDVLKGSRKSRRKMSLELLEKLLCHKDLEIRNEDEVLSLIDAWCSWGKRKSERSKLLQHVRFAHLTESAFEKCRKDPQCLEVMEFIRLLETTKWGDLNEDILSGRKTSRVHYHMAGDFKTLYDTEREKLAKKFVGAEFADRLVIHCSESGTLILPRSTCVDLLPARGNHHMHMLASGKGLFLCRKSIHRAYLSTGEFVESFTGFQYSRDYLESKPSAVVHFSEYIYAVAPPVAYENCLYIARMRFRNSPTFHEERYILEPEPCDYLEVMRYSKGETMKKCFRLNIEHYTMPRLCQCLQADTNRLFVNHCWMVLCLPNQETLVVWESPHPVKPIIAFPEIFRKMKNLHRPRSLMASDMVIVGDVAYVVVKFRFHEVIQPHSGEEPFFHGKTQSGSITAYDLSEGKWLPGHFVDLADVFAEKKTFGSFKGEWFELFLKVIQEEVFLIFVSNRVEPRQSGSPLAIVSYVYRVERSADKLWISPASDSAAANVNKWLKSEQYSLFTWEGCPMPVDALPCRYASMLQLKSHREKDPIEREKLRRFIW